MYWFQSSEISSDGIETRQLFGVCETRSTDPTNDRDVLCTCAFIKACASTSIKHMSPSTQCHMSSFRMSSKSGEGEGVLPLLDDSRSTEPKAASVSTPRTCCDELVDDKGEGVRDEGEPLRTKGCRGEGVRDEGEPLWTKGCRGEGVRDEGEPLGTKGCRGEGVRDEGEPLGTKGCRGEGVRDEDEPLWTKGCRGEGVRDEGEPLRTKGCRGEGVMDEGEPLLTNDKGEGMRDKCESLWVEEVKGVWF